MRYRGNADTPILRACAAYAAILGNPVMRRDKMTFDLSRDGRSRRERSIQRINAMNRYNACCDPVTQRSKIRTSVYSLAPCSSPGSPFSMFSLFSLYSQILPFLRDLHVPCSLVLHVLTVLSVLSDSSFPP